MTLSTRRYYRFAQFSLSLLIAPFILSACVSTEPVSTAPHINLSPEIMFAEQSSRQNQSIDFGLQVGLNESDSLENLEVLPGLRVRRVNPNSPAQNAGIKTGDVILKASDIDTNHPDALAAVLQTAEPGQEVVIVARRDTTVFETVLVGQNLQQSTLEERYRIDPILTRAGYRTEIININGQETSVARVVEILPDSPFYQLPANNLISVGEAIISIDGSPVGSAQGFINKLHDAGSGSKVVLNTIDKTNTFQTKSIKLWQAKRRISEVTFWPLFSYRTKLSPSSTQFSILDFWLFSIFKYQREENEKNYQLFTLFSFGTGAGDLVDESEGEL